MAWHHASHRVTRPIHHFIATNTIKRPRGETVVPPGVTSEGTILIFGGGTMSHGSCWIGRFVGDPGEPFNTCVDSGVKFAKTIHERVAL